MRAPGYQKHPNHRVDISFPAQTVEVRSAAGTLLAKSQRPACVQEGRYPAVWYLPAEDVFDELLQPSEQDSYCPFKGHASYWHLAADSEQVTNAVWSYEEPYDEFAELAGYKAFYADKVVIAPDQ